MGKDLIPPPKYIPSNAGIDRLLPAHLRDPKLMSALRVWRGLLPDDLFRAAVLGPKEAFAAFQRAQGSIDFSSVAQNQVLPHIHYSLGPKLIDDPREPQLKIMRVQNAFNNQLLLRQLQMIARQFAEFGLEFLIFKGAALAPTVYPHLSCRRVGDIDMLVREADFDRAAAHLKDLGWHPKSLHAASADSLARLFRHGISWTHTDHEFDLDLHMHINHHASWPGTDEIYWERTATYIVNGTTIRTLSLEDHLLQVCAHGLAQNFHPPVRWALDAHWILQSADKTFDWDRLIANAERTRSSIIMTVALGYLRDVLEADIPPEVLTRLSRTPFDKTEIRALKSRLASERFSGRISAEWSRFRESRSDDSLLQALPHLPDYLRETAGAKSLLSGFWNIVMKLIGELESDRSKRSGW
ncbi:MULTISPECIES: nucleotidyltransferase family protein [unclassified Sulfitobacter]|uniref:nucleotidyltransferase domain-containing protein n=1 Tax=unclassified Sulfitobacter TaxID=196795 RepID=UPI001593494F|nr:nucleotidyltransferase family protein [Sulfitobacter sp. HGT1]